MTAEIVNLRRARKAKSRDGRAAEADANRAKYGRTRAERDAQGLEAERLTSTLDNHRRDRPPGDD